MTKRSLSYIAMKTLPDQQDIWNGQALAQVPEF